MTAFNARNRDENYANDFRSLNASADTPELSRRHSLAPAPPLTFFQFRSQR